MRQTRLLLAGALLLAAMSGCHWTAGVCDCDTIPVHPNCLSYGHPAGVGAPHAGAHPVGPGGVQAISPHAGPVMPQADPAGGLPVYENRTPR